MVDVARGRGAGALWIGVVLLWSVRAWGIVVSDAPNLHVVQAPSDYDMVGNVLYLGAAGGSTAVLIDPWHILTARHVINVGNPSDHTFKLTLADGIRSYGLVARYFHPTADLAVARLANCVPLSGIPLYTGSAEVGLEGVLVGYGVSGTGLTGPDPNYPRGVKRVGFNRIDSVMMDGTIPYLVMDFDSTSTSGKLGSLGATKEVMLAAGDSGGPTLISVAGVLQVAGIHVMLDDTNMNGKTPDYGDTGYDIRVSAYASWILSQLPTYRTLTLVRVNGPLGEVQISPTPPDANAPVFPLGTLVSLTATPHDGRTFSYWEVFDPNHPSDANYMSLDANSTLRITMDTNREVMAVFSCGSSLCSPLLVALCLACLPVWAHVRRDYRSVSTGHSRDHGRSVRS